MKLYYSSIIILNKSYYYLCVSVTSIIFLEIYILGVILVRTCEKLGQSFQKI